MRQVELRFDQFGWEALHLETTRLQVPAESLILRAATHFVSEANDNRQAALLPAGLRSESGEARVLELDIGAGTWQRLRRQASRQDATVERLLEHAVLLFLADLDAGRASEKFPG